MFAIILMEFIVRFYVRVNRRLNRFVVLLYTLIIILEFLVMFSRMYLGMHSLNQVLFGCMLGVYSMVAYYLFVERLLLRCILFIFRNQKSVLTFIILSCAGIVTMSISVLISIVLHYSNTSYINVINSIKGCDGYHIFKSFQFKCMEDSAIVMVSIGIVCAFNLMHQPGYLVQKLQYSRLSSKYMLKFIVTLLIPLSIVAIFLNPLWY